MQLFRFRLLLKELEVSVILFKVLFVKKWKEWKMLYEDFPKEKRG